MMVWAILGDRRLSFVVWAHHMYVSGMNPYFGFFFATTTLIIAVPTAIKVYNWILTLWRGNIHLTIPMLFALAFIVTFVNGGLTGLFLGNVVVDVPLSDTMFVVAHFHMVMGVAPILVIFGAIYHWYPKVTGRMLNETLGKLHFWVTFLGAYAIFFPMHYLGLMGIPRRYHEIGEMASCRHPRTPERVHHRHRPGRRRCAIGVRLQSVLEPSHGQAGRRQSVAGDHAGMADAGNASAAWQLGQGTPGRLSLGLRLQRTRAPRRISCRRTSRPILRRPRRSGAWASSILFLRRRWRCIGAWWLSKQRLTSKPWLEQGTALDSRDRRNQRRAGEGRARHFSRRRRLAVRAVHQRLLRCACSWPTGARSACRRLLWLNTGMLI